MQSIWLLALLRFFLQVNAGAVACPFNQIPLTNSGNIISSVGSGFVNNETSPYVFETYAAGSNPEFNVTLFEVDENGNPTAAFEASWSQSAFLVRVGLHMDEEKKYTEYKNIKAEYAYTRIPYNCTQTALGEPCDDGGVGGDYSYIGVYGWFRNPLTEFYVVDDWLGNPYGDDSTNVGKGTICYDMGDVDCTVGSITIDGAEYKVYRHPRTNEASIDGPGSNFDQYFSVRVTPRKCGTIPLTEHFKEWESLGLPMGDLYEAKIITQTGGGIGWISYTHATVEANINDQCYPESDDHYERVGGNCVLKTCTSRRKNSLNLDLPCGSADCYWDTQAANTTKCIAQGTPCTNSDQYEQKDGACVLKACASRKKNSLNPDLPCGSADCYWDIKGADTTTCTPCTDTDQYEKKENDHTCVLKDTSASSITAAQTAVLLLTVFWLVFTL